MKVKFFTVAAATTIMVFGLLAQNGVSRVKPITVSGNEKNVETQFLNKTSGMENPAIIQELSEYEVKDGYIYRPSTLQDSYFGKKSSFYYNKDYLNKQPEKKTQNDSGKKMSVKKSTRDDVATITLRVEGNPLEQCGNYNWGFQMLIDKDCNMWNTYVNNYAWYLQDGRFTLYDNCEYKIPEGATGNLDTSPVVFDGEASIYIPEGLYDIIPVIVSREDKRLYELIHMYIAGEKMSYPKHNYLFKAGFEYIFEIENLDRSVYCELYSNLTDHKLEVNYILDYDLSIEIKFPPVDMNLTNSEDVTVVLFNDGNQTFTDIIELTYRIDGGAWITPETLSVSLEPNEQVKYTFDTKANFSNIGWHDMEVKFESDLDLYSTNNFFKDSRKHSVALDLPFFTNFSLDMDADNWTIAIFRNDIFNSWQLINNGGVDPNGESDYLVEVPPIPYNDYPSNDGTGKDFLISDPVFFPESGIYNFSFYVASTFNQPLRVLYGKSTNLDAMYEMYEMEVLVDFPDLVTNSSDFGNWRIKITNFEINTPGYYYFAFQYFGLFRQGFFHMDNVKISKGEFVGVPDLMFSGVIMPSFCDLNDKTVIGVEVWNEGTEPISKFTLTCQVGYETISQTFYETIGLYESITVYFDETFDFSKIGDYSIKFTASTPNEVITENNVYVTSVRKVEPLTELPFKSIFSVYIDYEILDYVISEDFSDWSPLIHNTWSPISIYGGCYGIYDITKSQIAPLLSRCFSLVPGEYIISYNYSGGRSIFGVITDYADFYVTYGKSGTDPLSWNPVKEYQHIYTDPVNDQVVINISEPGEYIFAFYLINESWLGLHSFSLDEMPPNIQLNGAYGPISSCEMDDGVISVEIYNPSDEVVSEFTLTYQVNNETPISQTFTEIINPFERISVDFEQTVDFSVTGVYNIKVTALSTNQWNEYDFIINHFEPITKLPFNSNFLNTENAKDWNPEIIFAWAHDFSGWYYPNQENIPLLSRCISLETGNYRFSYSYRGGYSFNLFGNITYYYSDFYVTYGKLGTEPSSWEPVKEYHEICTEEEIIEDECFVNIADSGEYAFAIFPVNFDGGIGIHKTSIDVISSISEQKLSDIQLTLYPNPTRGELRVENGELRMEKIVVYNATGQIMMTISDVNTTSYRLNVERLNSGLYFISVQTKNGIVNGKFVVK